MIFIFFFRHGPVISSKISTKYLAINIVFKTCFNVNKKIKQNNFAEITSINWSYVIIILIFNMKTDWFK